MEPDEKMSLINIKGGAAIEMFDLALGRALANVNDINTTLDTREIVLKVQLTPSEDRSFVQVKFGVPAPKLAGQAMETCSAEINLDTKGRVWAKERGRQQALPFGNVEKLRRDE